MASSGGMRTPLLLPLLLLLAASSRALAASIGVNYGANADNLPTPQSVASFLATNTTIDRVKLFDANPAFLAAFAASAPSISLAVSLPNAVLPALADRATGLDAARGWVRDNLSPHVPAANVTLLLAGNEILGPVIDPGLMVALLPAMRRLDQALKLEGLPQVRVTTPHYLGILAPSDGIPSNATFRPELAAKVLAPMLRFLKDTGSPLMVNAYPYFSYNAQTLDYAIFRPNRGIYDPATKLNYTSMLDAQMDAIYTAMRKLGYGDGVQIAVGEAGWPTKAEAGQAGVGVQEAKDFNAGMIRVCSGGRGTPLMPGRTFETYVFSLFDENLKPGPIAERNFGIFNPDFTPKYDLGLLRQGPPPPTRPPSPGAPRPTSPNPSPRPSPSGGGGKWCVVKAGASAGDLQNNINYGCGYVDCKPIQSGGACFDPNDVRSHASYVMNAYYQANGRHDYDCDFKATGVVVSDDPSYGSCRYVS